MEVSIATPENLARIRELNDAFRTSFVGGVATITPGVEALSREVRAELLHRVRTFDRFNIENDPNKEHAFGAVTVGSQTFYWRIDTYDRNMECASEDASDPAKTTRVLLIMNAEEY
jgi:hypothetical protein